MKEEGPIDGGEVKDRFSSIDDLKTETARGIMATGVQTSAGYVIGLLYYIIATRVLTREEIGIIVMLGVYSFLFAKLSTLSLNSAIAKFAAEARTRGEDLGRILGSAMASTGILSIIAGIGSALTVRLGGAGLVGADVGPVEAAAAAVISAGNVWVYNTFGYLSGSGDYRSASRVLGGYPAVNSLARIAGLPMGVPGVVLGMAAAAAGVGLYGAVSSLRGVRPRGCDLTLIREMVDFSIPIHGRVLLNYLRANVVDKVLVQWLAGPGALGVYSVAETLTHFLVGFSNVVSSMAFPGLVRVREGLGRGSVGRGIRKVSRYVFLIYLPVCALLAVLAGPLIRVVATEAYEEAVPVLAIFAISYSLLPLVETIISALMAFDLTWGVLGVQAVQVAVEGAVIAVLIPSVGLVGGAAAQGVSLGVGLAAGAALLRGETGVSIDRGALAAAVASAAVAASSAGLVSAFAGAPAVSLVLGGIVGLISYLTLLVTSGVLSEEDMRILEEVLPAKLRWLPRIITRIGGRSTES